MRCQSKKFSECPACARLYSTDQKRLIGSGCNVSERDGITGEMLAGYRFYFVTLTAPSFGRIHTVPRSEKAQAKKCGCGKMHKKGSELRGTPLNSRWYKYREQVRWNQASSELFRRSMRYTEELLPDFEWSFAREWQVRGALHFHGIIRVPDSYSETQVFTSLQKIRTYTFGDFAWGREIDVQGIKADSAENSVRYMAKVVSYTAKQQGDEGLISDARRRYFERLDWHAARLVCGSAGCKGDATCTGSAHRAFGYAGQMITRSRGWSLIGLNQTALVLERKKFATENHSEEHQKTLEILSKSWDDERRAELIAEMDTGGVNEIWEQELADSFFGINTDGS